MFLTFITRVVSFLYLCTCFFAYITCLYFTLDALMDLVWVFQLRQIASLSCCDLFSCKVFLEFIVLVRLMYFLCNSYGDCCFILLSWLCLWFYHGLPKREIVRVIFLCNWLILWQNAFYLGGSKLGLMYQGVCCSNITSDIIKDIKVDPRNKWRTTVSINLNTSSMDAAIKD